MTGVLIYSGAQAGPGAMAAAERFGVSARPIGAAAIAVPASATDLEVARAAAADLIVDVNFRADDAPPVRLFLADMDSTIIACECVDEIAAAAGVGDRVAAITERAMRGELDFEGALKERVGLLAGVEATLLERVYAERVLLNPGAKELLAGLRAAGVETALVSGGFTFFTERVAAATGFHRHQANQLEIVEGRLTGRVIEPILGRAAKKAALETMAAELGASLAETAAIGDGANDLDMICAAGVGVAYRAKPVLREAADARLDHSRLSAALALFGFGAG